MSRSPKVSVVLPTYNRAYSIIRAIESVEAQTFSNWELILVDDGSTDGTADLVRGRDDRLKLICQPNGGFVSARNAGLRNVSGDYVAFLDSDDEWLPYHLELAISFLETRTDRSWVATEILEVGNGSRQCHYRDEVSKWYPALALQARSGRLARPADSTDDYLRVYAQREPIGNWGAGVMQRLDFPGDAYLYTGQIFEQLRWGYLVAVNSLVMRRSTLESIGFFDTQCGLAADYDYTARLCREGVASWISIPTYVKHLLPAADPTMADSHLASGKTALLCARQNLEVFDRLYPEWRHNDEELKRIRGLNLYHIGMLALHHGEFAQARVLIYEAGYLVDHYAPVTILVALLRVIPAIVMNHTSPMAWSRFARVLEDLCSGRLSLKQLLGKIMRIGQSRGIR